MLAALRAAGGAAGVHQEQRRLGRHRHRLHHLAAVAGEQLIDEDVAAFGHRGLRGVLAGVAAPDQHLVDLLALLAGCRDRLVGLYLVIGQLPGPVVAVHGDQDPAAGVGDPVPASGAAEPAEHLRVNDAQPGAGQHGDRQLGHHRHV